MSPKQQRFVDEYLIDLNATEAAKRAGYSQKTARQQGAENLSKPVIAAAIAAKKAIRAERTEITQDYVLTRLQENVERAMTAVQVVDREGNPTGEYTYQGAVANRALELLGKHLSMFSDQVTVKGDKSSPLIVEVVETVVATRAEANQALAAHAATGAIPGRDHAL